MIGIRSWQQKLMIVPNIYREYDTEVFILDWPFHDVDVARYKGRYLIHTSGPDPKLKTRAAQSNQLATSHADVARGARHKLDSWSSSHGQ